MKQKKRNVLPPLESGQVWQMPGANLHIQGVGKMLVHYKLFKGEAKRAPTSLSGRGVVEQYLRRNKAVLVG